MMLAGTKKGEILRGLLAFKNASYSPSMVPRPPIPAPVMTPQRLWSTLSKSVAESTTACMPAATPYCMNSSMRRASFAEMY